MNEYFELISARPELFKNIDNKTSIKILTAPDKIMYVAKQLKTNIGIVYKDKYIYILRDAVIFPNGEYGTYIRIVHVEKDAGVILVPVFNNKVLLINHYRHALLSYSWELPRGFAEKGLSIEENAKKELYEECGLQCVKCEILGQVAPDSGIMSSKPYVLLMHVEDNAVTLNDKHEGISEYKWLDHYDIREMINGNKIQDTYTLSAFMITYSMFK